MVEVLGLGSKWPEVIQGGMGVAISSWELSRAVALAGEKLGKNVLPIISGTALPAIMIDRLQDGDSDTTRALQAFDSVSNLHVADKILKKFSQKSIGEVRRVTPKPEVYVIGNEDVKAEMIELSVAAAFVEIFLAKEGHNGPIGINLLEKIQLMLLPTLLGAMMAGVDYVAVGAGIPNQIPKVLKDFADGKTASYKIFVDGLPEGFTIKLDPKKFIGERKLKKPKFFPIISSHILAMKMAKIDGVDGFIVEGPLAGGHNAPARSKELDENGEPKYGKKDKPDLVAIKNLGKPFYLAGAYADGLKNAKELGAAGVQVGTLFALCSESGMRKDLAAKAREKIALGNLEVKCDPNVSPSGYPFMVAQLDGTLSQREVYEKRLRSCKYGYLAQAYQKPDDSIGFRCPAESVDIFVRKGGKEEETRGKVCLCEALIATAGHSDALPIITLGKVLEPVKKLMDGKEDRNYSAEDVLRHITLH